MIRFARTLLLALVTLSLAVPAALACGPEAPAPAKKLTVKTPADVVIPVAGMTCDSCANNVQHAVMALDGVVDARVTFADGKARVHYDAALVTVDRIVTAITDAGYEAGKPEKRPAKG